MAEKKTKAEQVAASKKVRKIGGTEPPKKGAKAAAEPEKKAQKSPRLRVLEFDPKAGIRGDSAIPLRYVAAAICALVLMIFTFAFFTGEGVLLTLAVNVFSGLFGRWCYYLSMPVLAIMIVLLLMSKGKRVRGRTFCLMAITFLFGCICHAVLYPSLTEEGMGTVGQMYQTGILGTSGGILCGALTNLLIMGFGRAFVITALVILCFFCVLAVTRLSFGDVCRGAVAASVKVKERLETRKALALEAPEEPDEEEEPDRAPLMDRVLDGIAEKQKARKAKKVTQAILDMTEPTDQEPMFPVEPDDEEVAAQLAAPHTQMEKVTAKEAARSAAQVEAEIAAAAKFEKPEYEFPPIDLLRKGQSRATDGTAEMRENTRRLNESLESFKIDAHISNVTRGPSVTRYEVELQRGVRLNKLTTCADDIALGLGASGVRIAPVPGKISVVGIEVPNRTVTNVALREVIDSPEFKQAKSKSSIAVGKDIGGTCIVGNIAEFPHMLIAGTTGSGKSVCMNSIIISLLYKASPEDVKLIMVDPKMVELGIYNGIPHLLIPVVTDPKKAAGSLQWAVTEMLRRYRTMSDAGVRDLESYNAMIEGEEIEGEKLPQVVVIIDELADLMLVAAKEVEESICRIAQMGRAAGIHLIIATQRPSADVITGLMKANIPSRIAFSVASAMESRIILDTIGAEKLVGKGDMLYSPIGSGKPQRIQGCFVSDSEVEAVAQTVKEKYATTYDQTVMDDIERKAEHTGSRTPAPTAWDPDPTPDELAGDEMLPQAVDVILETQQASVSLLQRRLKLGYARAARIMDEMEEKGIVGPGMGSKPRQILVTKEEWELIRTGQPLPGDRDDRKEGIQEELPF